MRRPRASTAVRAALLGGLVWVAAPTMPLRVASATAQISPKQAAATDPDASPIETELRDIKPLRPAKAIIWPSILAGVCLVALAGFGAWLLWRRRQKRRAHQQAAQAARPPHEVALAGLQALHRVNFADEAAVRQYYFAISEVLRAYVTARFNLMASQLTTEEIFSRLPKLVGLAPPENLRLRAFLAQTDQVKYAHHQATPEEIGATYEQAVAFINATKPQPAPLAPDAQGAA